MSETTQAVRLPSADAPRVTFIHSLTAPHPALLIPIRNHLPSGWVKPNGGLWTSPQGSGWGWRQWRTSEGYGDPDAPEHDLVPAPGTRVAVIDSRDDLRAFLAVYPGGTLGDPGDGWGNRFLDFEAMAADFDGLWLTERGQHDTRFGVPHLYGWDCETVLFFRWVFDGGDQ